MLAGQAVEVLRLLELEELKMANRLRCSALAFLTVVTVVSAFPITSASGQDYFRYPPYGSLRGHMVRRDGLFHVERYRWGNGLTPQGAAVLTSGIEAFAPIVPVLVTGGVGREANGQRRDYESRDSETRTCTLPESYIVEQRRANDLLVRTARLVDPNFSEQPSQPGSQSGVQPPPPAALPPISDLLRRYGASDAESLDQ